MFYLIKRLVLALLTLFTILAASYVLLRLAPGDPARSGLFGEYGSGGGLSENKGAFAGNAAIRKKLHLDRPVLVGFCYWMRDVLCHGDFGTSAVVDPGKPVTAMILERLPVTVSLNCWAILATYAVAVLVGVYAAVWADSWFDQCSMALLFALYSMPVMWVALLLQAVCCEGGVWPLFPLKGLNIPDALRLSTWGWLFESVRCYTLPVFCLSFSGIAGLSRYARGSMLDIIGCDFIRTARAKGVPEYSLIWKHAFGNSLIVLITLFGGLLPSLATGSVIVEYIFNIPGMGALSLLALSSRDYPLVMALFAFSGILTLAGILISDLLYVLADPRISLTGSKGTF